MKQERTRAVFDSRVTQQFKDCKLQSYEKRRLLCYFSVNPCMPASRWRFLLKLKREKKLF